MKYLLFTLLLTTNLMAQNQATLIYIGDPMCSWCYGFSPEFSTAGEQLIQENNVKVQLIMGGLRPYNTQRMPELSDFLKGHWEEVGQRSGQPFSYDILQSETFVYDTEPACRAVVVAREIAPAKEWAFFKKVQAAFYYKNQNTNELSTYLAIAKALEMDTEQFKKLYESDEVKQKVRADFTASAEMGVRGFPTVILEKAGQLYLIVNGYTTAEKIVDAVQETLN